MLNLSADRRPPQPAAGTAEKALSFLSKGWREVRDSADADLRLMRKRASSFKDLADRELEQLLHPTGGSSPSAPTMGELELVKQIQPKLSEIRRVYSSPEFGRRVLEKWNPKATLRIDLSAIKNAIVSEVDEVGAALENSWDEVRSKERFTWEGFEGAGKEWEPIRILKTRLREFEQKSQSSDIFGSFRNSEVIEKLKSRLQLIRKETEESADVPPLDLPELLAYLVKQSWPLFDQLGIRQGAMLLPPDPPFPLGTLVSFILKLCKLLFMFVIL